MPYVPSIDEHLLYKALGIYKERYGTIGNTDLELLNEIIKEIKNGSKTTTRKSTKSNRRSDK